MRTILLALALNAGLISSITWQNRTAMPRAEGGGASALLGDDLVIAGGSTWEKDVKVWLKDVNLYNTRANRWRVGPPLPSAFAYGAYAQDESGLEIFGGTDGKQVHRECWKLDAAKTRWTSTGMLNDDRSLFARAAGVGTRVFLFGGCSSVEDLTQCTNTVQVREGKGPWKPLSKIPGGAIAMSASAVAQITATVRFGMSAAKREFSS